VRTLIWFIGQAVKYSWYALLVIIFIGILLFISGTVLNSTLSYTYQAESFGYVFAPFIMFCIFSLGLLPLGLGSLLKFLYPLAFVSLILQISLYVSKNFIGVESMPYLAISTGLMSAVPLSVMFLILFSRKAQEYVLSSLKNKPKWK